MESLPLKLSDEETPDWDSLLKTLRESTEKQAYDFSGVDLSLGSFPEQQAFVHDDSDLQAVFCTRRAAKSYSGALKAFRAAMRRSRVSILIAGLHRDETKRIWWLPILKDIDERFGLRCKFNETELTCTLPNRSVVYLLGMDADEKQKRKALGQKFPLVLIDEAQDWVTDLNAVVFHVLKPAVADYNGTICLLGTPGLVAKGLFYDVTTGKEPGWKLHEWTTYENTTRSTPSDSTMAEKWHAEIEKLKAMKPGVEETPWFKRNYRKQWVVDEDALVYRYRPGRNDFTELPRYAKGSWTYVLGGDLGHTDATSLVVSAYHGHDPTLYFLEALSETGMDITDVADRVRVLQRKYDFSKYVIDGANKQAVEEMRKRHGIPWEPADKTGKADFIELMNTEWMTVGIKLQPERCQPLVKEYQALIWDQKLLRDKGKREEHPGCANHCADGALYNWRLCYQYLSERLPPPGPDKHSPEWHERERLRMQEEAEAEYEREVEQQDRRNADKRDAERDEEMMF